MVIPAEQRERLLTERGVTVTTACDRCGQVLSAVVYTKRDEPGVWCSKECRDAGVKERSDFELMEKSVRAAANAMIALAPKK